MALAQMSPEASVGRVRSGSVDARASVASRWGALGLTRKGMATVAPAWWAGCNWAGSSGSSDSLTRPWR